MKNILLFMLIVLLLNACNQESDPSPDFIQLDVNTIEDYNSIPNSDDFEIFGVSLEENYIDIMLRYQGGCGTHDFQAFWTGDAFPGALAFYVGIRITHQAQEEDCSSLITQKLRIDTKSLQFNQINQDFYDSLFDLFSDDSFVVISITQGVLKETFVIQNF